MTNIFSSLKQISSTAIKSISPRETGGPLVKTGPTAGQVRSRNQNGQWRRKRSDAGQSRK